MRKKSSFVLVQLAVFAAGSCTSGSGGGGDPGLVSTELEEYCAIAGRPDLVSWVGDVVTFCEQGEMDHPGSCSAGRVVDRVVEPIEFREPIRLALPASGGRLVVLLEDERLVLTDGDGDVQRELDRFAADPSVSADGERVAWIGLPDGVEIADADWGTPRVVAVQSLSQETRTVLVEDAMASAPRPVPNSLDVLYVSGNQEGISGFFLAGPQRGATQITNVGFADESAELHPVAGTPGLWAPDGALLYSVTGLESVEESIDDPDAEPPLEDEFENGELVEDLELDVAHLFRLVMVDDEAHVEAIGEGAWPQLTTDGAVLAALPAGSAPCATTYTTDGAP